MKRALDVLIALLVLVATSPVLAAAMLTVYMADRHAPVFSQTRLGKHEAPFTLYKLRTMRPSTPNVASHNLTGSALTPVGAVIRRTKLDELPQLVNVLRGEMALVGPRPGLPNDAELTSARRALGVFDALPGITGLAQVSGIDMSEPARLAEVDAAYIEGRSLKGDFELLVQTATGRGSGDAIGSAT